MNKSLELNKIAIQIERCIKCKTGKTGKAVPGEGDPNADIVFLGEAPGKTEAITGRPFVGRSGKLLRQLIKDCGLKEKGVFITSPVKYLPKRGTPTGADVKHGKNHLKKQLKVIDPKLIVLLGAVAQKAMLDKTFPVLSNRGKIIKKNKVKFFITLHPAAAIRFKKNIKLIKDDFEKLKDLLTA